MTRSNAMQAITMKLFVVFFIIYPVTAKVKVSTIYGTIVVKQL